MDSINAKAFPKVHIRDTKYWLIAKLGKEYHQPLLNTNPPQLAGASNHADWQLKLHTCLRAAGLNDFIKNIVFYDQVADADDADVDKFEGQVWAATSKATSIITMSLTAKVAQRLTTAGIELDGEMDPCRLLYAIDTIIMGASESTLTDTMAALLTLDVKDFGGSLMKYLDRLNQLERLLGDKSKLPDLAIVTIALKGIKSTYPDWYKSWKHDYDTGKAISRKDFLEYLSKKATDQETASLVAGFTKTDLGHEKKGKGKNNNTGREESVDCNCCGKMHSGRE